MPDKKADPIDTLKLSVKDRRTMIDSMEADRLSQTRSTENRRGVRVPFNIGTIVIAVTQPSGHSVRYAVAPRNLSTRGLAFVHGRFLYKNSALQVLLPDVDRKSIQILTGLVLDCRHITGLIHEVSVKFDKPMDLRRFVKLDMEQTARSRREIGGKALVVSEAGADSKVGESLRNDLGLTVTCVADVQAALREAELHSFDIVVTELSKADDSLDLCKKLREAHFSGMIIIFSSSASDAEQAGALDSGANCLLAKTANFSELRDTVETLLTTSPIQAAESAEAPMHSPLSSNPRMLPIVKAFVESLQSDLIKMQQALNAENRNELYKIVQRVRGPATSYGYKPLSDKAKTTMEALVSKTVTAEEWKNHTEEFMKLARRIQT
jgi:CheY-like chemotaxis protein